MQRQAQRQVSLFRAIVLAEVSAFLVTSGALSVLAQNSLPQNSVPPSARQAATMPQFAAKLPHGASRVPHPAAPSASYKRSTDAFARAKHGWLGGENELYDNGPINGTTDAWTINSGFAVSNSMLAAYASPVTEMTFGAWLYPGDVLESVEISITSSEFGGTTYFDGVVNLTQGGCVGNQFGFYVCTETTDFNGPELNAGTYWVNLSNAVVNTGDPVYWDENSGVGCQADGCPSEASNNTVGTIPSESFTVQGQICQDDPAPAAKAVITPPSPAPRYRVIYNFTGGADGGAPLGGLAIDAAGNLYGTTSYGGGPTYGGTAFKLSPGASGWRFNRLYTFSGANGSGPDNTPVLSADGRLVGTTGGGGLGYGTLFGLSPAPHILPSVFSNWMETLLYDFTGGSDGSVPGGTMALDSSGNIYGNTASGGANHGGTLYEFTNGGIQVLHAFTAFSQDGYTPIGVVNRSDGLYGITTHGGAGGGGTLYTTAGGYQVLHSFVADSEGIPNSLAVDQAGNLYGASSTPFHCGIVNVSVFQVSPPSWNPVTLVEPGGLEAWVSTDASGNIYGTTEAGGQYFQGNVFKLTCCWNYTGLHDFTGYPNDGDQPVASPVVDAHGNIYGTTLNGGTYGLGVVWEISP